MADKRAFDNSDGSMPDENGVLNLSTLFFSQNCYDQSAHIFVDLTLSKNVQKWHCLELVQGRIQLLHMHTSRSRYSLTEICKYRILLAVLGSAHRLCPLCLILSQLETMPIADWWILGYLLVSLIMLFHTLCPPHWLFIRSKLAAVTDF